MCQNCGCSSVRPHRHADAASAAHAHSHAPDAAALSHNDRLAERNRGYFRAKRVFAVNLVSFPDSGLRGFIERTVAEYGARRPLFVLDAAYLASIHAFHAHGHAGPASEAPDADENLHLDAHAVAHALDRLELDRGGVLLLVNSGSAAMQAVHDLGESVRVPLFSVRHGEAKPLKFPLLFAGAAAVLVNESDWAAGCHFDLAAARANLAQVAPEAKVIEVAPATGAGMDAWYAFLDDGLKQLRS